jgi:fibronectin-binding autotransporter adhesin
VKRTFEHETGGYGSHRPLTQAARRRQRQLVLASAVALLPYTAFIGKSARAGNDTQVTVGDFTDLSAPATYGGALPSASSDVTFTGTYTSPGGFDIKGAALIYGTLDDSSAQSIVISNSGAAGSISLSAAGPNVVPGAAGASSDHLFVAAGGNLTIQSGSGTLTLNATNGGNIDNAGTLNIAAPLNITGGVTMTFTGAGATTVTGGIAPTSGALNFSDSGSVTLGGVNVETGVTTLNSGTLTLNGSFTGSANNITVNAGTFAESASGMIGTSGSGLTLNGGTATLSGSNSYTGFTTVASGGLTLDFSVATTPATATNIISSGSTLRLGGGAGLPTITIVGGGTGASNSQTFFATTFQSNGSSAIVVNQNNATNVSLALGTLTRNSGSTVDLTLPSAGNVSAASTTPASNSVLVTASSGIAFATVGGANWAAISSGTITALGSYQTNYATAASNINVGNGTASATDTPASGFTVNTLRFNAANLTIAASGTNTVSTGGILVTSAGTTDAITGGNLQAGGGKELVVIDNGSLNIGSAIQNNSSASALTLAGTGSTTLSGANTYTGLTVITQGTVNAGAAAVFSGSTQTSGAFGVNSAVTLVNNATASLSVDGFNTTIGSLAGGGTTGGNVALGNNTLTIGSNNAPTTYAGAISGNGGLIKIGNANQTLSGSNSFSGGLIIKAGTVTSSNANAFGSGTITLGDSANTGLAATLAANTTVTMSNAITTAGNGINTIYGSNNAPTFSGNITLGTDLVLNAYGQNGGPGGGQYSNLTISGTISGSGNLTLLEQNTGMNGSTNASIKISNSVNNAGTITNSGNNPGADTILGIIGTNVTGVVQNSASSMLTLSGSNTYSSATTVSAGILKAGVASVAGVSGAFGNNSALTLANVSGSGIDITGFNTQIGSITGGGTTGGNVTLGAAKLTTGGDNTSPSAYAGVISGTGGVTKIGTGTQTFSGANLYSGATTVSGGTLTAGVASVANTSGAFGNNSALTLANVASTGINITGFNTQIGSITGGGTTGGNVTLGAATLATGGDNTTPAAYAGVISGTGGITKIGTGVQTFSGANVYSGATTVSGGTLAAGVLSIANTSGAFGDNSALILANAASTGINITGFNTQIGSITGGGTTGGNVTLGAATLTVGGDGTSPAAYAGAIAGTGGVTKIGNGTQIFSGSSTYSGVSTISAGTLQLGNASALGTSAVSLLSGALDVNGNSIANAFTSNATLGTLTNTGAAASLNGNISNNGTFTVNGTGNITLNGSVGGASGATITKNGNNTLTLAGTGDNGYLAVTVNAGTVILGKTSTGSVHALGGNSTINGGTLQLGGSGGDQIYSGASILAIGGTFDINSLSEGVAGLQIGDGTNNGSVTGTSGVLTSTSTISARSGSSTAILSGNASVGLTKTTSATVTLAGASTYGGTTAINAGTLRANNGASNGSATGSGNVSVAAGATLGGNGAVSGAVTLATGTVTAVGGTSGTTVANGGLITAGSSATAAGTLSTGNQTWGAGTALAAKIVSITGSGSTVPVAGTDNDTISAGAITASALSKSLPFDVQLLSGGSAATNFQAAGPNNYTFQLASFTGFTGPSNPAFVFNDTMSGQVTPLATSGTGTGAGSVTVPSNDSGLFVLDTSSFNTANPGSSSGEFELELVANGTGGAGYLDAVYYSSAPEPGTATLILGAILPMLIGRRRRRVSGLA